MKALASMAVPTVLSQIVVLLYNLADTFFIGSVNNPYMVGATSLALTIYLMATALSNVFGVGGASLVARLIGEKKQEDARKVAAYTVVIAFLSSIVFSLIVLAVMDPLLRAMGANDATLDYAKQYVLMTTVIGGLPCIMSMCMAQLLRNVGYAKESGIGIMLGSILNIGLDPLFMFVFLPKGSEVLGAGLATMISNVVCFGYFIFFFYRLRNVTPLSLPYKIEKIGKQNKMSLYTVGVPASLAILLFDIITIVTNRVAVSYGDISLAGMGIVLKLERIPINIGLGICLGMVPLVAYNFGARNMERAKRFFVLTAITTLVISLLSSLLFFFLSEQLIGLFIKDEATIAQGAAYLRGRCFALPFAVFGYVLTNYMNAVGKGKVSLLFAVIRHAVLIIPILLLMNLWWGIDGFTWSELVADVLNIACCSVIFALVLKKMASASPVIEPKPKTPQE